MDLLIQITRLTLRFFESDTYTLTTTVGPSAINFNAPPWQHSRYTSLFWTMKIAHSQLTSIILLQADRVGIVLCSQTIMQAA